MPKFIIHGGKPLKGEVKIGGSKNAALPIIAATLLTDEMCVIKNVPDIADIHTLLEILRSFGSGFEFKNHTLRIQTKKIIKGNVTNDLACKMRASVLLLGPLLARTGKARLPYPGGCVLGARPIDTHVDVLRQLGVRELKAGDNEIAFEGTPRAGEIVLSEFSVTATENALMAAARARGTTEIRLAAVEPHVQDLCRFLKKMGVGVAGIGTHTVTIRGTRKPRGVTYTITPDYLEGGTFILAAIVTGGTVTVHNIVPRHLDAMWNLLREMQIPFVLGKNYVKIGGTLRRASQHTRPTASSPSWRACKRLQTNVFPGFPTDLQPPFVVLLTQAQGTSKVHEALFEGRFKYLPELIKMGAKIETLNPHEAIITGPTPLKGGEVKSWDIRAGAAMMLAALIAKGKTVVSDIHYIDRGYEHFDEKLRALGADIVRVD